MAEKELMFCVEHSDLLANLSQCRKTDWPLEEVFDYGTNHLGIGHRYLSACDSGPVSRGMACRGEHANNGK